MHIHHEDGVLSFIADTEGDKKALKEYADEAGANAKTNEGNTLGGVHFFGKALVIWIAD